MRKAVNLILISFIVGGVGGVFFDRAAIPYLASTQLGERFRWLRRATERTTVINRSETVKVEESEAVPDLADRIRGAVVPIEIVSRTLKGLQTALTAGLSLTSDGSVLVFVPAVVKSTAFQAAGEPSDTFDLVASETTTGFVLLRSSQKRFGVLPFSDEAPRLGSRVFYLGALRVGDRVSASFEPATISAKTNGDFRLLPEKKDAAIIVDFDGEVIGMNAASPTGTPFIIPSAKLREISDTLLKKQEARNKN